MGRRKIPGLQKRFGVWHIDKKIFGQRVCESTGTGNLEEAERILAHRMEAIRQIEFFGLRPKRTFKEAAIKYLREKKDKTSLKEDARQLKYLASYIGDLELQSIHMGTLQSFIDERRKKGVKTKTINHALGVLRHLLNLAASEWIDEGGLTWLQASPKIKLIKALDSREAYPLTWDEQDRLFQLLPEHLRKMALFTVNTGCRDQEVCRLRWDWETKLNDKQSVFIIPKMFVKNREDRLVVLNDIAQDVIEAVRGQHSTYVFTYKGKPLLKMLSSAWRNARNKIGLPQIRVHDLKHTFGRRLRAAGVSFEDRQDLLGHKSGRITTHYCSVELEHLIGASNKVCDRSSSGILLRLVAQSNDHTPFRKIAESGF